MVNQDKTWTVGRPRIYPTTKEQRHAYYERHKDEIKRKSSDYQKQHPDKRKKYMRKANFKEKMDCLIHYGGNPPKCACCGEIIIEFLCIDHINGGGEQHRNSIGHNNFYRWLIKNNFPTGFQVLCANCNLGKRIRGICPHKKETK